MKKITILFSTISFILFMGCKTKQAATTTSQSSESAVVYKTKADYSKYVPVILDEQKTAIVIYPSPKDVFYRGKLAYPLALDNNYWLDNRGIGPHAAFLKLTYEEYAKLSEAPKLNELMNMILERDPFTEIYNLGARSQFAHEAAEINKLIKNDGLKNFTRIK